MIKLYPYENLGNSNYGWLDARYHFSFSSYYNPDRMGFGALRVINDDIVAAQSGFETHPHRDMEIITFVRSGAISHEDSKGNKGKTSAGDVQVMSAGNGVFHSEHNKEDVDTNLYQIWIMPNQKGGEARWDAKEFPKEFARDNLELLVSGRDEDKESGALFIYQDAAIYGGRLAGGTKIKHNIKHQAYVLASFGEFLVNDVAMKKGDGAEITEIKEIEITANSDCEILVIDVPR